MLQDIGTLIVYTGFVWGGTFAMIKIMQGQMRREADAFQKNCSEDLQATRANNAAKLQEVKKETEARVDGVQKGLETMFDLQLRHGRERMDAMQATLEVMADQQKRMFEALIRLEERLLATKK